MHSSFQDGNGRIGRLLTLLLLYQAGYEVGRYISLERIIEDSKETYYESLYNSSQSWHKGEHDIRPWWNYFQGMLKRIKYVRWGGDTMHNGNKFEHEPLTVSTYDVLIPLIDITACAVMAPAVRGAREDIKPEKLKKAPQEKDGGRTKKNAPPKT
jgi:hypothetical protein